MTRRDAALLIAINTLLSLAIAAGVCDVDACAPRSPPSGRWTWPSSTGSRRAQVAAVLVKRDSGDAERILAIQRAAIFGAELSKLIDTLPEECGCLVLTRGAVLGSGAN
jgi:hypothetical protein